jgi:hypothetical protein
MNAHSSDSSACLSRASNASSPKAAARSRDKKSVTPFESALRKTMLAIFVNLCGQRSQDWLYRYRIEWAMPACAA